MSDVESRRAIERRRLSELARRRPDTDDFSGTGVLLNDAIKFYSKQFGLITPLDEEGLKPANYKLRVGNECAIGGRVLTLNDESGENVLVIPPFEVAVIKTLETINMPRFLIARWNIQVKYAYQGLLWVGGPQVDAGYVGHLFCPIYNLSNENVVLRMGEPFAVIDFIKTTEFHPKESKLYHPPIPDRVLIDDYNPLKSALVTLVTKRLENFETRINKSDEKNNFVLGVVLTLIAILFAGLAVFVTAGEPKSIPLFSWLGLGSSVFAILLALVALHRCRHT